VSISGGGNSYAMMHIPRSSAPRPSGAACGARESGSQCGPTKTATGHRRFWVKTWKAAGREPSGGRAWAGRSPPAGLHAIVEQAGS
jgi:hypothetical protein